MLKVKLTKQAENFLSKIPAKHANQISKRILALQENPESLQTIELQGISPFRRLKSGEYRIVYKIEDGVIYIPIIGKRNDDEVYDMLKRALM